MSATLAAMLHPEQLRPLREVLSDYQETEAIEDGYTDKNTRLICRPCDLQVQQARRYTLVEAGTHTGSRGFLMAKPASGKRQQPRRRRPIPIVFDTSILRSLSPANLTPEFRLLQQLAAAQRVSLLVPEMAAREWYSQRIEPASKLLDQLSTVLRDLQKQASLADHPEIRKFVASKLLSQATIDDMREYSRNWYRVEMNGIGFKMLKIRAGDLPKMLEGYFEGTPPFGSRKAREDIPDWLVFSAVRRRHATNKRTVFVCADGRLSKATAAAGIATVPALPDLLRLKSISSLHSNPTFALWWETNFKKMLDVIEGQQADLVESLESDLTDAVANTTIRDPSIPSDGEGWVSMAGNFEDIDIDWTGAESLGEGVLSAPITFTSEVLLEFGVFRGDAFDVPDWVNVTIGDFEEDYYFEGEGYRRASFSGRVVVGVKPKAMKTSPQVNDLEVTIEDVSCEGLEE